MAVLVPLLGVYSKIKHSNFLSGQVDFFLFSPSRLFFFFFSSEAKGR